MLVYSSAWRSDALVLDPAAPPTAPVTVVPLPDLIAEDAVARAQRLRDALAALHEPGDDPFAAFGAQEHAQSELHDVLEWHWERVAAPVLDRLGVGGAADRPPASPVVVPGGVPRLAAPARGRPAPRSPARGPAPRHAPRPDGLLDHLHCAGPGAGPEAPARVPGSRHARRRPAADPGRGPSATPRRRRRASPNFCAPPGPSPYSPVRPPPRSPCSTPFPGTAPRTSSATV